MKGKRTVYEIKREIQNYNEQLQKLYSENVEFALANDSEGITRNKKDIDTITSSLEVLKAELERREKESIKIPTGNDDPINNKAIFYRSILTRETIPENVKRNLFGSNMTPSTGGEKFIPTTLAKELLHEPLDDNPLREIMKVTSIRGLETRKISYEIENLDFLKDGDTAKEIDLTGDTISFGRFKFKIMSRVSDTVMYGTDTELVKYIEDSLKSGLATKEKYCIFKTTTPNEEHMNIYFRIEKEDISEIFFAGFCLYKLYSLSSFYISVLIYFKPHHCQYFAKYLKYFYILLHMFHICDKSLYISEIYCFRHPNFQFTYSLYLFHICELSDPL